MAHSKPNSGNSKLHAQNEIFITSLEEINYMDLQKFLIVKFDRSKPVYPEGTVFYFITGIHHRYWNINVLSMKWKLTYSFTFSGKDIGPDGIGTPGATDAKLLQNFHFTLFRNLMNFCGDLECSNCKKGKIEPCKNSIWEDMKYDLKIIQLYTEKQTDKTYKLSDFSKDDLIKLSKELRKAKHSSALIFASCFTFYSEIKELMIANGVLAALNISKDRGEISEGKAYQLDEQQQNIIDTVIEVILIFSLKIDLKVLLTNTIF